ncbi:MAG: hypothetical protein HY275_15410 [Gemmatimonadetes bacterium]|nr:hypothetical protein [Gemmatimonadota bacterium]
MTTPTTSAPAPGAPATRPEAIDLADVQANIVRGYSARQARHFALAVGDPANAARFLRALLPDAPGDGMRVTTAATWDVKPPYCLNIGLTFAGVQALGVPPSVAALFPPRFQQGPTAPADTVTSLGDTGASAPDHWTLGGPKNPVVHLLVSLYVHDTHPGRLEAYSNELRALFKRHALTELSHHDAVALPDGKVHFGYHDGIAQPRIKGVPGKALADLQPECEPGEFLLGRDYVNQYLGNFLGDLPPALGDNGSYGAFRVLKQDVEAFEVFIHRTGARFQMDPELVAAKLMGRWRSGAPLVLSPTSAHPSPPIAHGQINAFDYAPTAAHPAYYDDREGLRCPIGSHVRRLNPRGSRVMGKPYSRRIIRRAMPYGPGYRHGHDDPAVERGLVGYFVCGDLEMQYEFMVGTWANLDIATAGIRGTRDPIIGAQPDEGGKYTIRTNDTRDPVSVSDLPRLVTTRGALYCFLPGIGGLRFLASLAP